MSRLTELARQHAVLAACRAAHDPTAPWGSSQACWPALTAARLQTDAAGLRAYQLNAQATAQRVMESVYPALAAMLGDDTLKALALLLWEHQPPCSGDLGDWGGALPELIAGHPDLHAWPWLPDCARLEWARHLCERAADATLDASSLGLLAETDPTQLHMALMPCIQLLSADWPVLALWEAHQRPLAERTEATQQALAKGGRDELVVWRQPWRLHMATVSPEQAQWMRSLMAKPEKALGTLLYQAPADFDFSAWLNTAVSNGWLWRLSTTAHQARPR